MPATPAGRNDGHYSGRAVLPTFDRNRLRRGRLGTRIAAQVLTDVEDGARVVAIELPTQVANFLQFIGINWPQVNEDKVRQFAGHVRDFAHNIESAHGDATATLKQMGADYQGQSYEMLVSKWAALSQQHMTVLTDACGVLATALDVAAGVIVGMKGEAIGELIAMAAAFFADQAAAVATLGLAEAAIPLIEAGAKRLVDYLTQQLVQYITGQVIDAALTPLLGLVEKAVSGMTYSALEDMLGAGGSAGAGFSINPNAVATHAATVRGHADTVAGHAQNFANQVSGMSFA